MSWHLGEALPGRAPGSGVAVVSVRRTPLRLVALELAAAVGGAHAHSLYDEVDRDPRGVAPGSLDWWGRGAKLTAPEWMAARSEDRNLRACFTRNGPVSMRIKLASPSSIDLAGTLTVTPRLDGRADLLRQASVPFVYPAGAREHEVEVTLGGTLPDEVGRYVLRLDITARGRGFRFAGPQTARLRIYGIYGPPFDPEYDSSVDADPGRSTSATEGTRTGTRKRLDHLFHLLGGASRRHPAATRQDILDLLWKLHVGINDTPGAPPYFDAGHTEHLTADGSADGMPIALDDQWLAWLVTPDPHWNDASCIGHVQLLKTMLASIGLFVRRTWIFPTTGRLPDGTEPHLADRDLYCLGTFSAARPQRFRFVHGGRAYEASPKLMEPGGAWENFEACVRTPNGRFLPGGYATRNCPASFRLNQGFRSAAELLRWWSGTSRPGFGRRFMCWVYDNELTGERHLWDVDGTHYEMRDYLLIRERGKTLPPPQGTP